MFRCVLYGWACMWVRDDCTRSCAICHKAKQRCEGAVWAEVEEEEGTLGRVEVKVVRVPVSDQAGPSADLAVEVQGVRKVLEELVEVQREYLQGQEEMKKEMAFLQRQVASAVIVMMEAITYTRDSEQDAKDYEEWVEGMMGEVLTRELKDLKKEEAAAVQPMEIDEEEEVEKEEKEKEGGEGSEREVEMVVESVEVEWGRSEVRS